MQNKINEAELNLQRKLEWIGRYDTRIAFSTGISIAMLGILANATASITVWTGYLYFTSITALSFLFISLIFVYLSQYPKTRSLNSSLIYFGTIADMKLDEFKKRWKSSTEEEYLDDLLSQIHINSEVLKRKFTYLKASLVFILLSVIPWLGIIYLSRIYFK